LEKESLKTGWTKALTLASGWPNAFNSSNNTPSPFLLPPVAQAEGCCCCVRARRRHREGTLICCVQAELQFPKDSNLSDLIWYDCENHQEKKEFVRDSEIFVSSTTAEKRLYTNDFTATDTLQKQKRAFGNLMETWKTRYSQEWRVSGTVTATQR
jgi:hypothetical protein